jgi:hypothetical protein
VDEPENYIDFMVKYKDWVSINRQELDQNTKPEEISFLLNNIRLSVELKYYSFLGLDLAKLDSFAAKATSGLKGYSDAGKALDFISSSEGKKELLASCADSKMKKVAESYLEHKIIEKLGIKTHIDSKEMFKLFPGLKIYKKRMPKGASSDEAEE